MYLYFSFLGAEKVYLKGKSNDSYLAGKVKQDEN